MKKLIRKIGSSAGVLFNKEEMTLNNWDVGDVVEVEIKIVEKYSKANSIIEKKDEVGNEGSNIL